MKKAYAAGLAMALLAVAAATVQAEVNLGGDARARLIYKDKYDFGNSDKDGFDTWDSRVRFNFKGVSAGGAYAVGRVRMIDTRWNGAEDPADAKNIWVDKAYLGIPMGDALMEAGRMKSDITKFLEWDQSVSRLRLDYAIERFKISGLVDVQREAQVDGTDIDAIDDNDWMVYGLLVNGKLSDAVTAQLNLLFSDDARDEYGTGAYVPDQSGFFGSLLAKASIGGINLESELAYRSFDALQTRGERNGGYRQGGAEDDGWGLYAQAAYTLDALTASLNLGAVINGFEADNDFGWIMTGNGNNEPIAVFNTIGGVGDWYWVAPSVTYAVSERLSLTGNFVFVNIDGNDNVAIDDNRLAKLYELSGSLTYVITEGADFTWKIGWLQPDFDGRIDGIGVEDDAAFGTYGRLQVSF